MQPCPRQMHEATMEVQRQHVSHWRDDGTCSYCGSLSPEKFFEAIDAGARLTPTDKDYKVYVTVHNPKAGQPAIMGASNAKEPPSGEGWVFVTDENIATLPTHRLRPRLGEWVLVSREPEHIDVKFYFQHLDTAQRERFVDLLNSKKLNIGLPGYFYRLPFFCILPRLDNIPKVKRSPHDPEA